MKSVYLVMSQTGTWLSRIIKIYTGAAYNHVSISLDNSFNCMYSFGRVDPFNPVSAGFVLENLNDGVYRVFSNSRCIIYRLEIEEDRYLVLRSILESFCENKKIYRYNFLGLFFIPIQLDKSRKNHYFCSQFVSEVLCKSGIYSFDKPHNLVTVKDLLKISDLEVVYEGYIRTIINSKFEFRYIK